MLLCTTKLEDNLFVNDKIRNFNLAYGAASY